MSAGGYSSLTTHWHLVRLTPIFPAPLADGDPYLKKSAANFEPTWLDSFRISAVLFVMKVLSQSWFNRSAIAVARDLLGKFLVRRIGKKIIRAMIVEVEAYEGFNDKASHASRGRTPRNFVMFGPPGRWYVYFTYGTHWMLNVVTGPKNYPAAVLIRAAVVNMGTSDVPKLTSMFRTPEVQTLNGPARLTKFLKIDKRFNNKPADLKTGLWLKDLGFKFRDSIIKSGHRIGISYAGPYWAKKKWRFSLDFH